MKMGALIACGVLRTKCLTRYSEPRFTDRGADLRFGKSGEALLVYGVE